MPIFIASLIGGLVSASASFVGRFLIALGVGYVTYQGIDVLFTFIEGRLFSNFTALPPQVIAILGLLKVGQSISVVLSAVSARMVLNGLASGAVTKAIIK